MEELLRNNKGIQILTDSGFEDFDGIVKYPSQETIRLEFDDGTSITCTPDHKLFITETDSIEAIKLHEGDFVKTEIGYTTVTSVNRSETQPVYDILNAGKNKRFYANNKLISNCEFITADETLINSLHLITMESKEVYKRTGNVRWYKPIENRKVYVAGLDPSLGTGGDNAAIQVYEVPSMKQVAEWMHNKTPITEQIGILRNILTKIKEKAPDSDIYWSVENNTLGEAALVVINEVGEENIPGTFTSQPKGSGAVSSRKFRKGFTTTNKSKLAACSKFKSWVETNKMEIASEALLQEVKTFVAKGASYAAKDGETDDLVMAALLVVRIAQKISKYDDDTYNELKDSFEDAEYLEPMPFIII